MIKCKCGCGKLLHTTDNRGRKHSFVSGHNLDHTPNPSKKFTQPCDFCKKPVTKYKSLGYKLVTCSNICRAKANGIRHRGSKNCNFKRGYYIESNGYIAEQRPGHPLADKKCRVLQHRRIAYDYLGYLPKGIIVHHINHVKTDNRIENLAIWTQSEHIKEHDPLSIRYKKTTNFKKPLSNYTPLNDLPYKYAS